MSGVADGEDTGAPATPDGGAPAGEAAPDGGAAAGEVSAASPPEPSAPQESKSKSKSDSAPPDAPPSAPPSDPGRLTFPDLGLDLAALLPRLPREPVRLRRRIWLLLAVVAAAIGLDLRVAARDDRPRVRPEVMRAARERILEERKPGNLVVHSPLFTLAELAALGDLQAKPDVPSPELRRTRRVWVIDAADNRMFMGLRRPSRTLPVGDGVVLHVYDPARDEAATLFDLTSDLDRVELRVERPRGTVSSRCTAPRGEGGRACPGEADWLYLAPRTLLIEGKNTECVWAHPTTGGDLVYTLPAMPEAGAGKRLVLSVASAMTDDAVRMTPDGASVRTDIEQSGRIKGGVTLVNRIGWARTEVTVEPNAPTELRVSTPRDGRRHHCITARIQEGRLE